MGVESKITAPLFLVFVLALILLAGCGQGAERAAGQGESAEVTVKRLADFETGVPSAELPDSRGVASSGEKENASGKKATASVEQSSSSRSAAGAEKVRSDGASGKPGAGGGRARGGSGKVKLEIGGDPGTEFTGTCTLGGEQKDVSGQVPESYNYDLAGENLSCEIRISGDGALETTFTARGDRQVQKIKTNGGTLKLSYTGDGLSSVSSSSTSVTGSSQQSVISSSSD